MALQNKSQMKPFVREAQAFVGEDDFEMLETSLVFAELGLVDEAARLLSAVCVMWHGHPGRVSMGWKPMPRCQCGRLTLGSS